MSQLGGNEEGVGGRADSPNFFKIIPSSLRESHLGEKIPFFLFLLPYTCDVRWVGGASTGATWGESCSASSVQESHFTVREIRSLWKNESGKG